MTTPWREFSVHPRRSDETRPCVALLDPVSDERLPSRLLSIHETTGGHSLFGEKSLQLEEWMNEARTRENTSGTSTRSSFFPFPSEYPLPADYRPTFFLRVKPAQGGNRTIGETRLPTTAMPACLGVACVEVRLLDVEGRVLGHLSEGRLNQSSHSALSPASGGSVAARRERINLVTRTAAVQFPLQNARGEEWRGRRDWLRSVRSRRDDHLAERRRGSRGAAKHSSHCRSTGSEERKRRKLL